MTKARMTTTSIELEIEVEYLVHPGYDGGRDEPSYNPQVEVIAVLIGPFDIFNQLTAKEIESIADGIDPDEDL